MAKFDKKNVESSSVPNSSDQDEVSPGGTELKMWQQYSNKRQPKSLIDQNPNLKMTLHKNPNLSQLNSMFQSHLSVNRVQEDCFS